jgi:hypothetical protein
MSDHPDLKEIKKPRDDTFAICRGYTTVVREALIKNRDKGEYPMSRRRGDAPKKLPIAKVLPIEHDAIFPEKYEKTK